MSKKLQWGRRGLGRATRRILAATDGTFTVSVMVPTDAPLGPTTIEGLNGNCTSPTTPFTVTPAASCPSVQFLGAHGVNEGSRTNWGNNIQAVWNAFHTQDPAAVGVAANYPYISLDWPLDFKTVSQAAALQSKAQSAAQAIEPVFNRFTSCGTRTRFVLAGYSLGAWAVDLTLRGLNSTVAGKTVLAQVAGAAVMGDPAFPVHMCKVIGIYKKCREGVATFLKHVTQPNRATWPMGCPTGSPACACPTPTPISTRSAEGTACPVSIKPTSPSTKPATRSLQPRPTSAAS